MRIQSALSKEKYLSSLKGKMSGHMEWGAKRFTGFFLGSCFYVTHHAGYEWNRRYTNQKNAALGYVKQTETGSEVHFVRFRGTMCPMVFLPYLLILEAIPALYFLSGQAAQNGIVAPVLYTLIIVLMAFIEAFFESLTEKSETGRRMLLSMLRDPPPTRRPTFPIFPKKEKKHESPIIQRQS